MQETTTLVVPIRAIVQETTTRVVVPIRLAAETTTLVLVAIPAVVEITIVAEALAIQEGEVPVVIIHLAWEQLVAIRMVHIPTAVLTALPTTRRTRIPVGMLQLRTSRIPTRRRTIRTRRRTVNRMPMDRRRPMDSKMRTGIPKIHQVTDTARKVHTSRHHLTVTSIPRTTKVLQQRRIRLTTTEAPAALQRRRIHLTTTEGPAVCLLVNVRLLLHRLEDHGEVAPWRDVIIPTWLDESVQQ